MVYEPIPAIAKPRRNPVIPPRNAPTGFRRGGGGGGGGGVAVAATAGAAVLAAVVFLRMPLTKVGRCTSRRKLILVLGLNFIGLVVVAVGRPWSGAAVWCLSILQNNTDIRTRMRCAGAADGKRRLASCSIEDIVTRMRSHCPRALNTLPTQRRETRHGICSQQTRMTTSERLFSSVQSRQHRRLCRHWTSSSFHAGNDAQHPLCAQQRKLQRPKRT